MTTTIGYLSPLLLELSVLAMIMMIVGRWIRRLLAPVVLIAVLMLAMSILLSSATPTRQPRSRPCAGPIKAVLYVYRADIPTIAEHIATAQRNGAPRVLCRNGLSEQINERAANYNQLCGRIRAKRDGLSCDEYPFASTYQGGEYASAALVPLAENSRQGGQLNSFYRANAIRPGDNFGVLVI